MRLQDKVAIVTGGGGSLGEGICRCFAREGARVAVSDLNLDLAETVAAKIQGADGRALPIQTDVSSQDDVERLVAATTADLGSPDIMVCCAGVTKARNRDASGPQLIEDLTVADWDFIFAVNMRGVFLCNRAVAPIFREKNSGKIINISSISGRKGVDFIPAYAATKAGVISFTQSMALQLAPHHVNVNAICPGIIYSPLWEETSNLLPAHPMFADAGLSPKQALDALVQAMVPFKTYQTPEDIGNAAVFLASDEAKEITGQSLNVCGGMFFS